MASEETQDLIERAERLASRIREGSPEAEARFEDALARLRRSAGIEADPQRPHSVFAQAVLRTLLDLDWVVADHPRSRRTEIQPDFYVETGDRRIVVEAKTTFTTRTPERVARDLVDAVEAFGAEEAWLVVPDGAKPDLELPVRVLTLSELRSQTL